MEEKQRTIDYLKRYAGTSRNLAKEKKRIAKRSRIVSIAMVLAGFAIVMGSSLLVPWDWLEDALLIIGGSLLGVGSPMLWEPKYPSLEPETN